MNTVTTVLALELGRKIRVNAVAPGPVETEANRGAGLIGSDFEKKAVSETPFGRIGQPKDIADAVAFLASPDSTWVNGQAIQAAGGYRL